MKDFYDFGFVGDIVYNERINRFSRNGKILNAWYVGFQNHQSNNKVIVCGDWTTGEKHTFSQKEISHEDQKYYQKKIDDMNHEREILYLQTAQKAKSIWASIPPAPEDFPYFVKKKIKNFAHISGFYQQSIVIPVHDMDGVVWGLQFIHEDGSKKFLKGMKKKDNFFRIQGRETTFIVEGFATGASVHDATGATVIVAFDAGNIASVAKQFPDAIVAGDSDEAGRKACKGLKAIFPIFKNQEKQTDWNDLACSEGLEEVRRQLLEQETSEPDLVVESKPDLVVESKPDSVEKKETLKSLGYNNENFYFISSCKPQITKISASGFTKPNLLALCSLDFWESNFPAKKSFDLEAATNTLMMQCRDVGFFDSHNVRGSGVWLDNGRVVQNCGDKIYSGNQFYSFSDFQSNHIYEIGKKISPHHSSKNVDFSKLYKLLSKLSWRQKDSAKLLLGWLVLAPICGALPWRPHVWITGASGSGKTTVMNEIISKIIQAHQVTGRSTEAGIRQLIGSNALPLMFDENETTDQASMRRVDSVIELFRQASSESNAFVAKGTPSGKGMSYSVRFMACVSSINVGLHLEQDINRFTVLELIKDSENGFNDVGGVRDNIFDILTPEYCDQFRSFSFTNVLKIIEIKKVFFEKLRTKVSARFAEQYGSLLAGYACCIGLSVDEVLEDFNFKEFDFTVESRNEKDLFSYIMQSRIVDGGKSYSVAQLVKENTEQSAPIYDLLSRYGMRVTEDGMLAIAMKHPELSKLLADSPAPRRWGEVLFRINGAEKKRVRIGNVPTTAILVPLDFL